MKYLRHVDGLRALAIVPVVLFHFNVWPFRGGYVGVDVFFVISGFLITGVIQSDLDAGKFSLARFYERRARRILPPLVLMCALALAAARYLLMPNEMQPFARSLVGVACFSSNFVFARATGYFVETLSAKPLLHTWSLGVEEQFYVLFPLLLLAISRVVANRLRATVVVLAAILVVSFALNVGLVSPRPESTFFLLHTRAWELLLGALLQVHGRRIPIGKAIAEAMGIVGAALVLGASILFTRNTVFPGVAALVPTAGTVLLIWSGLAANVSTSRLLSTAPMVAIGKVSYGLYLFHWPILVFAQYWLMRPPTPAESFVLLVVIIAVTLFSYFVVENPIRAKARLRDRRALFAASIVALGVFAVAGWRGNAAGGWPQRFGPDVLRYANGATDMDTDWARCAPVPAELSESTVCRIGDAGSAKPDFIVWGDSHVVALQPALTALAREHHKRGWAVTYNGCPPLVGIERIDCPECVCADSWRSTLKLIARSGAKHVLLISRWDMYGLGWEKGSIETNRSPEIRYQGDDGLVLAGAEAFARAVDDTVRRLEALGITVTVLRQIPPQLLSIPTALAKALYLGRNPDTLRRAYDDVVRRLSFADSVFVRFPSVRTIDPLSKFCPAHGPCQITAGGHALYIDNNHLSTWGAAWGARPILDEFFRRLDEP